MHSIRYRKSSFTPNSTIKVRNYYQFDWASTSVLVTDIDDGFDLLVTDFKPSDAKSPETSLT